LKTKFVDLFEELKDKRRFIKFIRLDDAAENASNERARKEKCLGIKFEVSSPRISQRNRKVKRKFQTLYGRVR
jgi:hypothetical protein